MNLPADWWQYRTQAKILCDHFRRYLLGLLLSFRIKDETHHQFYTGFLLEFQETLLWITAGHVVDGIKEILTDRSVRVVRALWADGYERPRAEALPVDLDELLANALSASDKKMDFGAIAIRGLNETNIRQNGHSLTMTDQAWKNIHLANPEGFYILGFPDPWFKVSERQVSENQVFGKATANISCLPVQRIVGHPIEDGFWSDSEAFYGQVLPFIDGGGFQPETIVGMSGGPLFSIERDKNDQFRYYLFGLQRSWLPDSRVIRAEPIQRMVAVMDSLWRGHPLKGTSQA